VTADGDALTEAFEAHRPRLVRVAYATVGAMAEAEDCVQEAWLRLRRVEDPAAIRDLGAWPTTTVSRLALDALTRARVRRERYAGPWLPEPLVEPDVVWRGDGGGKVAAHHGARGAWQVAGAMLGMARRPRAGSRWPPLGRPGAGLRDADGVLSVISFTVDAGRITAIDVVRNPDKLSAVREPGGPGPAGQA
jgi:hypothetical protein